MKKDSPEPHNRKLLEKEKKKNRPFCFRERNIFRGRADGRDDSLTHPGQDRLLSSAADQLVDVRPDGHPRLGDELDAVLGHGGHRWRIDDLRVDGQLHGIENVPPGQVAAEISALMTLFTFPPAK